MYRLDCGDNLTFLQTLENESIDLIYCDILYGTGRDFGEYKDLKPIKSDIENHYLPRFIQMKRVLKKSGTIYIHTGYQTSHWIRCLLDDVFGYKNFRNEIIWHYNSSPRKNNSFGNRHDTIYRYSVSDNFTFNPIREPYSLSAPRGYEKEKYYHPDGKVIGDVWSINILGQNDKKERTGYPTQKPKQLIDLIVRSSSNEGDVVADFYAGSHTTGEVALSLNRKYIGCDLSEKSIEIGKERLKKHDYINYLEK